MGPRKMIVGGRYGPTATAQSLHCIRTGQFTHANLNMEEVSTLIEELNQSVAENEEYYKRVEVVIAPVALHIPAVLKSVNPLIKVAAQNIHWNKGGAFTGEITADQVHDFGLEWTIVGHSERRANRESGYGVMANETPETCAKKARYALSKGLKVMFCFGETAEHRKAGLALDVCKMMLWPLIAGLPSEDWKDLVLAYEPVWAIGTGRVATIDEAESVHAGIRSFLSEFISPKVAKEIRITYGGSVKPNSAVELSMQDNIDGFLVGGASLEGTPFSQIIAAAANSP